MKKIIQATNETVEFAENFDYEVFSMSTNLMENYFNIGDLFPPDFKIIGMHVYGINNSPAAGGGLSLSYKVLTSGSVLLGTGLLALVARNATGAFNLWIPFDKITLNKALWAGLPRYLQVGHITGSAFTGQFTVDLYVKSLK